MTRKEAAKKVHTKVDDTTKDPTRPLSLRSLYFNWNSIHWIWHHILLVRWTSPIINQCRIIKLWSNRLVDLCCQKSVMSFTDLVPGWWQWRGRGLGFRARAAPMVTWWWRRRRRWWWWWSGRRRRRRTVGKGLIGPFLSLFSGPELELLHGFYHCVLCEERSCCVFVLKEWIGESWKRFQWWKNGLWWRERIMMEDYEKSIGNGIIEKQKQWFLSIMTFTFLFFFSFFNFQIL